MFQEVPQGDAIFMKWILHDWSDDHCTKLLKNCYKALQENGKIIIVEAILPFLLETSSSVKVNIQIDATMMTQNPGGKERTEDEFLALAKSGGFNGRQVDVEGDGYENVHLYYDITDKFQIQFGREEFCLVTDLRFGVENLGDYNDSKLPIPFRRRVFPSCYDGEHITGHLVLEIIEDEVFDRLHDEDAVSLCCLGILQLVLLGVEAKRRIPDWMLRLANDRVGWDNYPWGSFVWPTLYSQLKNANVKRLFFRSQV
ncbi:phospholipase-like protein [Tanacetum coccineum]